jgi:hypothetical protein
LQSHVHLCRRCRITQRAHESGDPHGIRCCGVPYRNSHWDCLRVVETLARSTGDSSVGSRSLT